HHRIGRGVEAVHRAHRRARRVGAVHAGHGDRALARLAVVERDHAAPVDAPWHLVLVLAGGDAGVALDATVGVAAEFHPSPAGPLTECCSMICGETRYPRFVVMLYAALIWQRVALGSCIPVTGS